MIYQCKLLTKLNPRYVRVFKSLPWLGIEFYASKISMSFCLFITILCAKISSVYKPKDRPCQGYVKGPEAYLEQEMARYLGKVGLS
jgi:hypothetical protein